MRTLLLAVVAWSGTGSVALGDSFSITEFAIFGSSGVSSNSITVNGGLLGIGAAGLAGYDWRRRRTTACLSERMKK